MLGDWSKILVEDDQLEKKRKELSESNDIFEQNKSIYDSNKRIKQSNLDEEEQFFTDTSFLIKDKIKEMIISKFDTKKADSIFEKAENSQSMWLDFMIDHKHWRELIYELAEKYSDCLMLNFAIQRVSEAGYQREIASLSTASTFFPVFNKVLQQTLQSTFTMDDHQLENIMPELIKMCCHSQHTYFYSQILLNQLIKKQPKAYNLRNISHQLRNNAIQKDHNLVMKIHQCIDENLFHYKNLSQSLSNIFYTKKININELNKIEAEYREPPNDTISSNETTSSVSSNFYKSLIENENKSQEPQNIQTKRPSVKYLRDPLLLRLMIEDLFDPKKKIHQKNLCKYIYLISFATVVNGEIGEESQREKEEIDEIEKALHFSINLCKTNLFDQEFQKALPILTNHLRAYPIVSVGILYWVQLSLMENDTGKLSVSLPYILLLLRSNTFPFFYIFFIDSKILFRHICFYQSLQRDKIIQIIQESFEKERSSFDVLASANFRKKLLNTLLYVLRCGHVLPVLFSIKQLAFKHDSSLIRYFLGLLIQNIEPPYSELFVEKLLELISISMPSDLSSLQSWEEKALPFIKNIPQNLLQDKFSSLFNQIQSHFSKSSDKIKSLN